MIRHGGFVLQPNVLLLRSIDHLLLSRPFSAFKLTTSMNETGLLAPKNGSLKNGSLKNGSLDIGTPKNGSLDIGSLKVKSAILAATASSLLLSDLLRLESSSTEENYATKLEEEIERRDGSLVMSDNSEEERVAVDVEGEEGMKAEEAVRGETALTEIIQSVWGFNSSSVFT